MQRHGAIEISFGGAHPNSNGGHLNDLRRMLANHVAPQNPIGLLLHHQLEQTTGPGGQARAMGKRRCTTHHPRRGVRWPVPIGHGRQLWIAEHGTGHQVVVHLPLTRPKTLSAKARPSSGHGREVDPIGDIADGMDMGHRGAGIGIDLMRPFSTATPAASSPRSASQGRRRWPSTHRKPKTHHSPPRRRRPGLSFHSHHRLLKTPQCLLTHATQHGIGQLGIKTAQQARTTYLGDRNTKAPQDAGDSREACAHHNHGGRDILQQKHVVTDPGVFNAWNLRPGRTPPHRHQKAWS